MIFYRFYAAKGGTKRKMIIFPMHILFSTIYLLQQQQLNSRTYSKQKKNVINFAYTNYHGVHMYANIQCVKLYIFL
jgi:hypothetical protein